jgi:hypothetical protein
MSKFNKNERKEALRNYYKHPKKCLFCNKIIRVKKHQKVSEDVKRKKFCSRSCVAKYTKNWIAMLNKRWGKKRKQKYCKYCHKKLIGNKHKNTFCSSFCHNEFKYTKFIEMWLRNKLANVSRHEGCPSDYIRRYLFNKYKNKCSKCGWSKINPSTGKIPLQINHKDGNSEDHRPYNLELLCPNCHALTPTYGILNKGKGRKIRLEKIRKLKYA